MGNFLKENIPADATLYIVSAYFTIYAYEKLQEQLDKVEKVQFLFGEPNFLQIDPTKKGQAYKINDLSGFDFDKVPYQRKVAKDCYNWIKEKVEIKSMVKPDFLHGKMYFIHPKDTRIDKSSAVTGSSNFTVGGLGLGNRPNIELNLYVHDDRDLLELKKWFDDLWENKIPLAKTEDVKAEVLKFLKQLWVNNSPELIYFKTLFHVFQSQIKALNENNEADRILTMHKTKIWGEDLLYTFQREGVKGAINRIQKYGGCVLADSVGLGKTYQALAIIKYFEILGNNVLVICPKKLEHNWKIYQSSQNNAQNPLAEDKFQYSIIYHTDIGRTKGKSGANNIDLENFAWEKFGLVVIDESHNFKGNPKETTKDGKTKMNRPQWLLEKIIKNGIKTKVLLLSATPVNNNLADLRNQILLITGGETKALKDSANIPDIKITLANAQKGFTEWSKNTEQRKNIHFLTEKLGTDFFKLLDAVTIARSRKQIMQYYADDMLKIGNFPKRNKPISHTPNIDNLGDFPSYDNINTQIQGYKLVIFNPSNFIKKEFQEIYEGKITKKPKNFSQIIAEERLIGMMKVGFLKRLESSISSFAVTLKRTIEKIENLLEKIDKFQKNQNENKAQNEEIELETFEENDEIDQETFENPEEWVGKKLKINLAHLNLELWKKELEKDKDTLKSLRNNAKIVTPDRDEKLQLLKKIILEKTQNPFNVNNEIPNKKVIVFTAYSDTAKYLYENMKDFAKNELKLNIALITGSHCETVFGKNNFDEILTNFSPISKKRAISKNNQNEQIDILIATDCISEGQNLQDCDYLVNYDIHWNPVRIIQRFGRIDRLGSKNTTIQLVNFWATPDLDKYINLKERVEARMALVDITATGEDNILKPEEIEDLVTQDLKFRHTQLKALKEEVLDLEDMQSEVSISDFSLEKFRMQLAKYLKAIEEQLADMSLGLYAVVPAPLGVHKGNWEFPHQKKQVRDGILLCLRQKSHEILDKYNFDNPLFPYFFVFVEQDGENGKVKYSYKSIEALNIFESLCLGQKEPFEKLCEKYDEETDYGKNMTKYNNLLKTALNSLKISIQNENEDNAGRNDKPAVDTQILKNEQEFELISWVVIV